MSQTGPPADLTQAPTSDGPPAQTRVPAKARPPAKGEMMGKEARVALILAGSACLVAVMLDWVISELQ
jgi:hypothetical protein